MEGDRPQRGKPITKVFQIEKTQEVYVRRGCVAIKRAHSSRFKSPDDAQPGILNPEPGTSTLERFVTAALVLGLAAERQGDLFGLLTFTDKVETFVRARNGKNHYGICRDALYTLQPKIATPDFDELCTFIRLRLRRRALLVFLTALDDPALAESFVRNVDLIRRQHLVLVNMLQMPGVKPLFTDPDVAGGGRFVQPAGRPFAVAETARVAKGPAAARSPIFTAQQRAFERRTGLAIPECETKAAFMSSGQIQSPITLIDAAADWKPTLN